MDTTSFAATTSSAQGYKIPEWCAQTRISRAALYALPHELQPASIHLGRARIIIESPGAWLARMAQRQALNLAGQQAA